MKTKRLRKLMSIVLVMSLSSLGTVTVNSVSHSDEESTDLQSYDEEIFVLPDIISESEAKEHGYIGRDYESEPNLYTFIFKNSDGTNTMKLFGHPVKYEDENGKVKDISFDIQENDDGSFSTVNNNIITTFSSDLTDGINIVYNDIDICMIPDTGRKSISAVGNEDTDTVTYRLDDNTSYEYKLMYSGFKEDIVVTEYTGQTEFDFTLYTNGLKLVEQDGSYYLFNEKNEYTASIGDIIVNTADGRSDAVGSMTYLTVKENEEYVLTIHIGDEYLMNESTMYPIRIDPTISINASSSGDATIEDITLNSNDNVPSPTSSMIYVGKRNIYGKSRILMRFPNLDLFPIKSSVNISSAKVELQDLSVNSYPLRVYCCLFNGSWEETGPTWNGMNQNNDAEIYTTLSEKVVSSNIGANLSPQYRYSFNIKQAVQRWKDGTFDKNTGIIFKASQEIENLDMYMYKFNAFGSFENAYDSYKPSLTITYSSTIQRNQFFSKYTPSKYNMFYIGNLSPGDIVDNIQFRMNCYGYSFCNIIHGTTQLYLENGKLTGYKQEPGEFVSTNDKYEMLHNNEHPGVQLFSLIVLNDPIASMNNVKNNLYWDAKRFGYSLVEYIPSSSQLPQYGTDSRLVAVVTGNTDYHFYMQHSDGTWSHKPGSGKVTNRSLNTTGKVILTNDNIYYYANKGAYLNGQLKFFVITKSAIIDQPHGSRCCLSWPNCSHQEITLMHKEKAGDSLDTSAAISGSIQARIDYVDDVDFYFFPVTTTKTYNISIIYSPYITGEDLELRLYNNAGICVMSDLTNSPPQLSLTLYAGSQYYIAVRNDSINFGDYTLSIN